MSNGFCGRSSGNHPIGAGVVPSERGKNLLYQSFGGWALRQLHWLCRARSEEGQEMSPFFRGMRSTQIEQREAETAR